MQRLRWFFVGVFSILLALGIALVVWISQARGFSARAEPTALEGWVARWARSAALPRDAGARQNPVANTPEVLAQARAHWADHCAACHANDGSGDTEM